MWLTLSSLSRQIYLTSTFRASKKMCLKMTNAHSLRALSEITVEGNLVTETGKKTIAMMARTARTAERHSLYVVKLVALQV